jgi:DNA-binding response OmpR family regulator
MQAVTSDEEDAAAPLIKTLRGIGYKLDPSGG